MKNGNYNEIIKDPCQTSLMNARTIGFSEINKKNTRIREAINEVSNLYHYACLSANTALQIAQSILSSRTGGEQSKKEIDIQSCYEIYADNVEQAMEDLVRALNSIISSSEFD